MGRIEAESTGDFRLYFTGGFGFCGINEPDAIAKRVFDPGIMGDHCRERRFSDTAGAKQDHGGPAASRQLRNKF